MAERRRLNPYAPQDAVKLIKQGVLLARDTTCPTRTCWQPHEWRIPTHGAQQTHGRTEWRCAYRERQGCPTPQGTP